MEVAYNSGYYLCIQTTPSSNPQNPTLDTTDWVEVAAPSISAWEGTWSPTTAYLTGQAVNYTPANGSENWYVALTDSTGAEPDTSPSNWDIFVNQTCINAGATYYPLTNPLSATTSGSSSTITIAGFAMVVAGTGDVSITGGTLSGLLPSTLYDVYYPDPLIAGGSVVFLESTTKSDAISSGVNFYVGSITTPATGAPTTVGNADGGNGISTSQTLSLYPSDWSASGGAAATNPQNAADGSPATYATLNGTSVGEAYYGFPSVQWPNSTGVTISVDHANAGTGSYTTTISYSLNGGSTWTSFFTSSAGAYARQISTVTVTPVNIGLLQVRCVNGISGSGIAPNISLYRIWLKTTF
jgi:hypothetical protein